MRGRLSADGHTYLIALGSNVRHHRFGAPRQVLARATSAIASRLGEVLAAAPLIETAPLGPSHRRYANGALLLRTPLAPQPLLRELKTLERSFGRRPGGQRWRARVLDLDIALWSGGAFAAPALTIPHAAFRTRAFVLGPAAAIAPGWRDPLTGLTMRQLAARLTAHRALPRSAHAAASRRRSRREGPLAQSVEQLTFNQ